MNRRALLAGLLGGPAALWLGGCGTARALPAPWHNGQLTVGTGPTNGVFSQVGTGYADVITRHLPPYEAVAVPTNGAGENLARLVRGDCDVAFTFADVAATADASIRALARVFNSYTHLVVRVSAGVEKVADLAGLRVGTGPAHSGTEYVAQRVLKAAGIEVKRVKASLTQMTADMRSGSLDAMFYSAGLPTVGLTALFSRQPGVYTLVALRDMQAPLAKAYPGVYVEASIPRATYGTSADVATVAVPNLVVAGASLPEQLGYDLTRMIFEFQPELAEVHPEGKNISLAAGAMTSPLPLHPGAQRYYDTRS